MGVLPAAGQDTLPSYPVAAVLVMDAESGAELYSMGADRPIPPASLTKIMTLYLVFDALSEGATTMDETIRVDESVQGVYGATLGLKPGDAISVGQALRGVAVASANDAAIALAIHIAGSEREFVQRMNEKAAVLSFDNSYYINPHGLPAKGQRTTAADVARLARMYIRHHPEALQIHGQQKFEFKETVYTNRNTLLGKYPGLDGLKTGFIKASGYCLVATARKNGVRLLSVVLGARSPEARDAASVELLEYGFATLAANRASD